MRTIALFSIAIIIVVAGFAAWSASTHSAVKAEPPQTIDPLSLEANAKNLPSQEELNLKLWPQDAIALSDLLSAFDPKADISHLNLL
jgi:hypothetical protein